MTDRFIIKNDIDDLPDIIDLDNENCDNCDNYDDYIYSSDELFYLNEYAHDKQNHIIKSKFYHTTNQSTNCIIV